MNTDNETGSGKRQFTDSQLRALQIAAGIVSAIVLIAALYMPQNVFNLEPGDLLSYSFVVVFLGITFGRRSIENKYRLRLGLFSLSLMLGVYAGIIFFVANMFYFGQDINLSEDIKTLILVGMVLLLLVSIIALTMRYYKRKAQGTLKPIRLPEVEEPKENSDDDDRINRPMTLEEKIAQMTNEIDKDDEPKE